MISYVASGDVQYYLSVFSMLRRSVQCEISIGCPLQRRLSNHHRGEQRQPAAGHATKV